MDAIVLGNAALDVLCWPVEEVPRQASIGFARSAVGPGGCGSNVAVGLSALGLATGFVTCVGADASAAMALAFWQAAGIDLRYVRTLEEEATGVSVGLVDQQAQPRFLHTPGASRRVTPALLQPEELKAAGVKLLHIAGFFVLPGLEDGSLPEKLAQVRAAGVGLISLDVVESPGMLQPEALWGCLPHLDWFFCNRVEAQLLTGEANPEQAARQLRRRGALGVVVKLGGRGCWISAAEGEAYIPTTPAPDVVDTTGAGDAFDAGFLAQFLTSQDVQKAGQAGNQAGARMLGVLGAVQGWGDPPF